MNSSNALTSFIQNMRPPTVKRIDVESVGLDTELNRLKRLANATNQIFMVICDRTNTAHLVTGAEIINLGQISFPVFEDPPRTQLGIAYICLVFEELANSYSALVRRVMELETRISLKEDYNE